MSEPRQAVVSSSVLDAEPDDASIIGRSRQDPEAFALLFRRHARQIHRYLARRIGPANAEDILSETFLMAFRHRSTYDLSRPDALPWLYGIATNLIGRHRRAETKQLAAIGKSSADDIATVFTDAADARLSAHAVSARLAAAIRRLRPAIRDTLLLVAWGDLTYEEVATALGVPVGTVRSRVSRARQSLRRGLGGVDPTSLMEKNNE